MKISHRLIVLSTVSALALVSVGAVGLYGVRTIQEQFDTLTTRTTPLKNALLEQQELKERAISGLIGLSYAASEAEAEFARDEVRARLVSLAEVGERITALDADRLADTSDFESTFEGISDMVFDRLGGIERFGAAAETARLALNDVDTRIERVGAGVRGIADEANRAAAAAQETSDGLVRLQRQAQGVSGLLADMTVLLYATDALSSKFRLGPLQERFVAAIDTLERMLGTAGQDERLTAALPDPAALRTAFADEGEGLFALRLAVLEEASGAKRLYKGARKALLSRLNDGKVAIALLVDELEFEIALERRSIEAALALSGDPASIIGVNQSLSVGAKNLAVQLERLLLSSSSEQLSTARDNALATLDELLALADGLATGLEAIDRPALQKAATGVGAALAQTRDSMGAVYDGITRKLDSESAVSENLTALKDVAASQRERGEIDVAEISGTVALASESVGKQADTATFLIVALCSAAVLLSIGFSLIIIRSIIGRLRQALQVADAVSLGRLDPVVAGRQRDEISLVMDALDRMVSTLDGSVRKIRTATVHVNAGAEQISAGNGDLSGRTEQQASRLSEAAGITSRISDVVKEGALAAKRASELSENTSEVAGHGRQAVQNAMASMQSIESGAREISNITAVIDAISFQTNILALNAAVEASRAGESGRGFAVVAAEVGSLARKSKESVLQIKEIIDKNVQHVESGSALVSQAGRHMEEVVEKVGAVTELIGEVSLTSQRQVEEISQIDGSVSNLEQMTRQNATLSERTTSAAMSLLEQSRALDESVSVFSLPEGERTIADAPDAEAGAGRRAA